jgi:DNA-binding PadR family transcriptional regulator
MPLTENQREVLSELKRLADHREYPLKWCIPMDLGASNGSHHSDTLNRLADKGWVQFKQRGAKDPKGWANGASGRHRVRGSKCYRITPLGREALSDG